MSNRGVPMQVWACPNCGEQVFTPLRVLEVICPKRHVKGRYGKVATGMKMIWDRTMGVDPPKRVKVMA